MRLAWPLLVAQITQTLMGVTDTIMAGRYAAVDMAAVALGFSVTIPILCVIQGIALAIPPILSRFHGGNDISAIARAAQQAGYLLALLGIASLCIYPFVPAMVSLFPMEPALFSITTDYVQFLVLGLPGFALYQWLRNLCESLGNTKPTMTITVIGLGVNIIANYFFIYGVAGIEGLGGAGCGLATSLVYAVMATATAIYTLYAPRLQCYRLFTQCYAFHLPAVLQTLQIGVPIALTLLFEVTLFAVVALLLAPFGASVVAAHQVALNFSSLMFMFPMSMGMATSIRVAYRLGQGNHAQAFNVVKAALLLGTAVAGFTAAFTVLARSTITQWYTNDADVLATANYLLLFAALFQFSDAVQVISAHSLRGFKDTTAMSLMTFCAYWLCGLPVGIILARTDWLTSAAMGAAGFWIGFIVGLSTAAVLLGLRLMQLYRRHLRRPA